MGKKLARDRIAEIKWKHEKLKKDLRPTAHVVEHYVLLTQKLLEECGEFISAANQQERANEAADVLEVMIANLMVNHQARWGVDLDRAVALASIMDALNKKYEERGGFDKGTVYVGEGD